MGQAAYDLFTPHMADRLQELSVFVRTAETGSFSRVARELGVSQPSVSRLVANLEARLGVTLLLRTTRRVTPTEAGSALVERARQILGDLDEAENAVRSVDAAFPKSPAMAASNVGPYASRSCNASTTSRNSGMGLRSACK